MCFGNWNCHVCWKVPMMCLLGHKDTWSSLESLLFCTLILVTVIFDLLLVSWGCCNKVLQIGWLKMTEIYCLTVLEVRSPKSMVCLKPVRESFLASYWFFLSSFGIPLLVAPMCNSSFVFVIRWSSPCVSLSSTASPLKDTSDVELETHFAPVLYHLP